MKNRIIYPALFLIGGVIVWTFSQEIRDTSEWKTALIACAFILWIVGLFLFLDWIAARWIARRKDLEVVKTTGVLRVLEAKQRYLETFGRLTPQQLDAIGDYAVTIEHVPTTGTYPFHRVIIAGRRISFSFLDQFVDRCDEVHLAAVRTWNTGTRPRLDAEALTEHFIRCGFAFKDESIENYQARWYSPQTYQAALRSISYSIVRQVIEEEGEEMARGEE